MAGDVQQPFSLSFQVEALHSSSISFGRFELESLSWERRSSFSHNRYLEEVEKYAKPGSVTEKKAYFEAHFKKRALLRQSSSISQAEREGSHSESSSYSTSIFEDNRIDSVHEEEPRQMDEDFNLCHFDESPKGSSHGGDVGVFEYEAGSVKNLHSESQTESLPSIDDRVVKCSSLETDFYEGEYDVSDRSIDRLELKQELTLDIQCSAEKVECSKNEKTRESESTGERVSMFEVQQNVGIGSKFSDTTPGVLKEQCISESTAGGLINQRSTVHIRPRTSTSVDKKRSPGLGSRPDREVPLTAEREVKKGMSRTNCWNEKQAPKKVMAQKHIPESAACTLQSSVRPSKQNPQILKPQSPHEKRSENDVRPKRAVTPQPRRAVTPQPKRAVTPQPKRAATPQPSTPERSESRRRQSAASSTRSIASTGKETGQSVMNSSFRSTAGSEKKRDKIVATDIRQLSKTSQNLRSVTKPIPRISNREKPHVVASNTSPAIASIKTLRADIRPTTGSKPCSVSRVKKTVSSSTSAGTHFSSSLEGGSTGSSSTKCRVKEATQRKEAVHRHEKPNERKPKAKEHGHITKGKFTESTRQDQLDRSSHGLLRKSMGHSSSGPRRSGTITETPKVGPVRAGNPFLRRSMGH
ncbi:hypothetical protein vseg_004757 [Gypsophila vaccaria]